jgi:hypothetical protein
MNQVIESVLRIPRLRNTLKAARKFDATHPVSAATDPQRQYDMRSSMDFHPKVGKWISRKTINVQDSSAWQVASASSSRFVNSSEIDQAVAGIKRDGFYIFSQVVDPEIVSAIRGYSETAPCSARGADTAPGIYPRSSPQVGRYDFDEETALGSPEVQEFVTDPLMALISQKYLGQPVLMDEVALWWTTTKKTEDANINAQLFHQDRDRLSFLKFFIYLTDVEPDTGPHMYIRGSHANIPWSLRGDGRKSDEAVKAAGLWNEVQEIIAPAGTLMAVDTIGLHKGKTPISADRLALENEYATSLFGMHYEIPNFEPTELTLERYKAMPWVLQRYSRSMIH